MDSTRANRHIEALFRRNIDQYQTTINQLIFISCIATGIWAIALFFISNRLGFLNIPYEDIIKFALATVAALVVTAGILWWYGKKPDQTRYINLFKYSLLTCAGINYLCLILFIPYHEMWLAVFYFLFLCTLFFDARAVFFFSLLVVAASTAAYFNQPDFRPENAQELLIRAMNFSFAVFGAVITSVLSRRLFRQNAVKEYELSVSVRDQEQRRRVAEGLRDMLAVLNSERSIDEVLDFIVTEAVRIVDTDACALYKLNSDSNLLTIETISGLPEDFLFAQEYKADFKALKEAATERRAIHVADISEVLKAYQGDYAVDSRARWAEEHITSMLVVPLISKKEVYGGICFLFKKDQCFDEERCFFSDEKIKLASAFADQAALAIENARLREETQEMAVAEERNRLARDLHDAVTQSLFSASLIAEALPAIWDKNQDEGRKRLVEIKELSRGALAEMRALLLELRPVTLVETSLNDLLAHLSEAATGRARIPVRFENTMKAELPVDVKIAFYRIAQEAVNNIVKHAHATQASIVLKDYIKTDQRRYVEMTIVDDGRGFAGESVAGDHIGLDIMKERAQAIEAALEVKTEINHGTAIHVTKELRT